ncbi:recombination regulator RecX [Salirhabdus salicampi]|uniref:recombination regulator RecX n=1 Tax=Salirhabdus salicampi TaxID=476102 RepID=UPI0020C4F44F|nr:recombination regulator RecX [Salirhabdus salicampi]MCP8617960.1 recombination regulator RecX [Salirhabdus salicampi]
MIKITKITTQKKNKQRYNIYIDEGNGEQYGFSVSEDLLIKHMLRKGMELDQATVQALQKEDDVNKYYSATINFLSYRMRSEKEIRSYLVKKEAEPPQIDQVVEKLKTEGYLDDLEFARAYVKTRINTSSKGPQIIKKELFDKGVNKQNIEEALHLYNHSLQFDKALKVAEKKVSSNGQKSQKQLLLSLQNFLMQKGFNGEVIQSVLEEIKEHHMSNDMDIQAIQRQGDKLVMKYERKFSGFQLKQKVKEGLYRKGFSMELIDQYLQNSIEDE